MSKDMQDAGAHLDTAGIQCGRGQVVEVFMIRRKSTKKFIEFKGTYSNYSDEIWTPSFNPTQFTREQVENLRHNLPSTEDFYRGFPMKDLEFVRFTLSESPEVL